MPKTYNYCLDFIKGIACICVVLMHCEFPGLLGVATQAISRFCVPLFFMVSGFFCFKEQEPLGGGIPLKWRKIRHIALITVSACILYVLFDFAQLYLVDVNKFVFSTKRLVDLTIFNVPFIVAGQYWFLFALLYDYFLYSFVQKYVPAKVAYGLAAFMFVAYIFLAQGMHLAGVHVANHFYRNWLVEGYAFFMLGHWIHAHLGKLKFSNTSILTVFVISTLLCWVERFIMGRDFGVNIVTIPQVIALFLYATNNPTKHEGVIQRIGKKYSLYVYVLHPIVWHSMEYIYGYTSMNTSTIALYAMPLIVVGISLLVSRYFYKFNILINDRLNNPNH